MVAVKMKGKHAKFYPGKEKKPKVKYLRQKKG